MKHLPKTLVCLLLVMCLLIQVLPVSALAAGQTQTDETATESDTQQITTRLPSAVDKFTDVKAANWFYNAVFYVTQNQIFSGTSSTTFTPNGTMTRAMLVKVLANMAGIDEDDYTDESGFSDVPSGKWYSAAVVWAAKYGIVSGTGNGKFSPDRNVTRQEAATIFVRYFTIFGVSLGDQNLQETEPKDLSKAASWAQESVLVLWQRQLLCGDGTGNVNPLNNISRAECASLCSGIHKQVTEEWKSEPSESQWVPVKPGSDEIYTVTFLNADGEEITTMNAHKGLGLGTENTPYYAHPDEDNAVYFWGWFFYDEDDCLHLFNALYPYNEDMTVFAVCGKSEEMKAYLEDECYVLDERVPTTFTVTIRPADADREFNPEYDLAIYADEYDRRITYNIKQLENGDYEITVDNYKPGVAYSMVLDKDFIFLEPTTGEPLDSVVRYLEYTIQKATSTELHFRDDIVWISKTEKDGYKEISESGVGIVRPLDDTETSLGTGTFVYDPSQVEQPYEEGTVICVYDDGKTMVHVDGDYFEVSFEPPYCREYDDAVYEELGYTYADIYGNADDYFYVVTSLTPADNGLVQCEYRELGSDELEKVLYVPDVIPFSVSTLPDRTVGTVGTIENYASYDSVLYAEYSGADKPSPEVGDFVVLYTPDIQYYGDDDFEAYRAGEYDGELPYVYGEITAIDGMQLTYSVTTEDAVVSAVNYIDEYYVERSVPKAMLPDFTATGTQQFEEETAALLDEEAIRAFLTTALEEEAENGSEDAEEALKILEENEISMTPDTRSFVLGESADDSKKIQVTGKNVAASFDTDRLSYIANTDGKWKISLNVGMMLIVKLRLQEGVNLYYTISGNFTQELSIGISASGRFDVKWYGFVPVPQHLEFSVSALVDTATDVTLDVRHYTVDKSHNGTLYTRQANAQELWDNYQNFLLTDAFVCHGAAVYSKEAEYYSLVADALAIPAENVEEREAAEKAVRVKAKEINAMWEDEQYGLSAAWDTMYVKGGSTVWSEKQEELAKKAAADAKDELVANVINISQHLGFVEGIVDWFTTDTTTKATEIGTELADLNPDGTETDEWKASQEVKKAKEELENAKAKLKEAEKEQRAQTSKDLKESFEDLEQLFKDIEGGMTAVVTSLETVIAQMRLDEAQNASAITRMEEILDVVTDMKNTVTISKNLCTCVKNLATAVDKVVQLASGDIEGGACIVAEIYEVVKSLSLALKDVKLVLAEIQSSYCTEGDENYENCQEGIDVIVTINKYSDTVLDLFHTLAILLDSNTTHTGETTDGITNVPTTSTYWKFRTIRNADFEEFSLNTEILNKLNNPEEGIDDDNIAEIASKYAEMCAITSTWMDLYRSTLVDESIPIFPGLDVVIGADFVVQADINVAMNFNFHIDYGKEFRITIDVLDWEISTDLLDRGNQKLSISVIAMGTLGLRTGFELKFGLKIIEIFEVTGTVEIMPYINLYAYVLFQYNRDLKTGASETKFKGSMYIDVGVHIGFNLALKLDILIYKNTWKFNLWNKNISFFDIGERRNVYNFGYNQPSIEKLENSIEDAKTAAEGTEEEKEELNTGTDGILIVNPATDYKLPGTARMMSYMDMTNGSLGKAGFDAGHYEYTFFTVPEENDGNTYEVANNIPLYYEMEEVPKVDDNGNIIYKENDGEGIPLEITVDVDESGLEEKTIIAANQGTPETEWVQSDKLVVDDEGIAAGKYVEDTRFSVDDDGVITFTPEEGATGTYCEDVYVYIEWVSGTLEGSNYPIRRLVHILWTNEEPLTWLYSEVWVVEQNKETGEEDSYLEWSDTFLKGVAQIRIPSLTDILDDIDPTGMLYERETSTYVGEASNYGTTFYRPQESQKHYIAVDIKDYSIEVRGLNADGTERTETYTEEYDYILPVPETFTPQVETVDDSGNPKYLKFVGYQALQEKDGTVETWTGHWDEPISTDLAMDLTDTNYTRYLEAVYEDETVKAVFTFDGVEQESITQYLRRGSAPDMAAIQAVIDRLTAKAATMGKTLHVGWSEVPGAIVSDREFVIYCYTTSIEAPQVTQVGSDFTVQITENTEDLDLDENDILVFGFAPNTAEQSQITWLPQGTDTVQVDPEVEYRYYARLTDGDTLERTYSAATLLTVSGELEDTGYTTLLKITSDASNPDGELTVTVKLKYTTGTFSDPVEIVLQPGKSEQITISSLYTPDQIGSVYLFASEEADEPLCESYKLICTGTSSKDSETWRSKNVTIYFDADDMEWKYGKMTFTQISE